MHILEQRIPSGVLILIAGAIAVAAIVATALLLPGDQALADGGKDSLAECEKPLATATSQDSPFTAPAGQIVTGVCIKGGENTFPGDKQHSGLITADGTYGNNDCFVVSDIGTPTVSVTANCRSVSHIDVTTGPAPTPTPTPTATPTESPTPTPTPTVSGEVLGEVQGPQALPESGGAPTGGSGSYLPLLLALGGLALLGGAGTFAVAVARRRR